MTQETAKNSPDSKGRISLDLRIVSVLLLIIIAVMLFIWKPWSDGAEAHMRTVEVRGETIVTAKPDEFVFYPTYEFKGTDKNAALAELTAQSDKLVAKLKELGVTENKIKTNSSAASSRSYAGMPKPADDTNVYTLALTVTVNNESLAQKVQDYLVTTTPIGGVSPQANFSDAKRKQLENEARDKAIKDAKAKADQTAKELGFKVDKVKSVSDGAGFSIQPVGPREGRAVDMSEKSNASLGLQPGENELPYVVIVVYFIR